ncbi:hypothetical protein B566_EDAN003074 [Ephemera danica]|nr:hypothetical protein B566_EDAN003074 [Ephemera danica]
MQQSKSTQAPLSKKKRNIEKNLKNIIALPYEKFWPLVEGEDKTRILDLLQRLIAKLRQEKQVPRQLLQGKTVEEQRQIKKSVRAEWEAKEEYKEATKISNAGFSCLALAIKKEDAASDPTLVEVVQMVSDVSSRFELPVSLQTLVTPPPVSVETSEPEQKPKSVTSQQVKALHLPRPPNGRPAFMPSSQASAAAKADFISLGSEEECGLETPEPILPLRPSSKKKSSYQPLVVKRLQPNPDKVRNKKKKNKKSKSNQS